WRPVRCGRSVPGPGAAGDRRHDHVPAGAGTAAGHTRRRRRPDRRRVDRLGRVEGRMTGQVLRCERVVTAEGVREDAVITIEDGMITGLDPAAGTAGEPVGGWVLPGYVDTHVHGGGGGD